MQSKNKKKLCVVGSGYVGLVSGACFADVGHIVYCIDNNKEKIEKLKKGVIPIYEPGLEEIVKRNFKQKRLFFSDRLEEAVSKSQAIFIAVGTPSSRRGDGYADLTYVYQVAKEVAPYLDEYKVIVDKSTVPVGTANQVQRIIKQQNTKAKFDVVSNPEFLREGAAIEDFLYPDRIVIGTKTNKAAELMRQIYSPIIEKTKEKYSGKEDKGAFLATNIETAELIKYASNAFLATKIAFINELANLSESLGANILDVAKGMGLDHRISKYFLNPGPGYGGSCFPKDVSALLRIAQENNTALRILESVYEANIAQKAKMVNKILNSIKKTDKTILFLGLTFKPNTDDMRDASSLTIIPTLVEKGYEVLAHDPKGIEEAKKQLPQEVQYIKDFSAIYSKAKEADAVVILTHWDQYKKLDFEKLKSQMKGDSFIDLRNMFDPEKIRSFGFKYVGLGR
ncbi:MAG: nucleotide sugar dehydrogenase [Candidatus Moranbacteria bacterium]|nr:nucleotide sugar dehydrogenase [Candidatus Moranbacteria bacterium]